MTRPDPIVRACWRGWSQPVMGALNESHSRQRTKAQRPDPARCCCPEDGHAESRARRRAAESRCGVVARAAPLRMTTGFATSPGSEMPEARHDRSADHAQTALMMAEYALTHDPALKARL